MIHRIPLFPLLLLTACSAPLPFPGGDLPPCISFNAALVFGIAVIVCQI